jgi:hypothetical protein
MIPIWGPLDEQLCGYPIRDSEPYRLDEPRRSDSTLRFWSGTSCAQLAVVPGRSARMDARIFISTAAINVHPAALKTGASPVFSAIEVRTSPTERKPMKIARSGSALRIPLNRKASIQAQSATLPADHIADSVTRMTGEFGCEEIDPITLSEKTMNKVRFHRRMLAEATFFLTELSVTTIPRALVKIITFPRMRALAATPRHPMQQHQLPHPGA